MRSYKLDGYKGIACIFVVFIHCVFPGILGTIVKGAARFAVPLFFMSAGYYCCCRNSDIKSYVSKKVKHVMCLLIAGSVPWIIYEFVMNCFVGNTITVGAFLKHFFAVENFKDLVLWNNPSKYLGGGRNPLVCCSTFILLHWIWNPVSFQTGKTYSISYCGVADFTSAYFFKNYRGTCKLQCHV